MKKTLLFSIGSTLLLLAACGVTRQPIVITPRVPATFDYSPPSRAAAGTANTTIILLRPRFIGNNPEYLVPPFNEMAAGMSNDFEELLTAKGFTIRGPFGSRDEIVYSDKTSSDFSLEVHIDLNMQYNRHYSALTNWGSLIDKNSTANFYRMSGEVTMSGNLVLTASSPQYGEKLWKKNIALEPQSFTYTGQNKWTGVPSMADELKQDNLVYNTVARELEKYYGKALSLSWQQIDPAEMKEISTQAHKADRKS